MKRILLILMLSLTFGGLCLEAGSTPQKRTQKKATTAKKATAAKKTVYKCNVGSWKEPNYIAVNEGEKIMVALIEKYGNKVIEVTSDASYDILAIAPSYSEDNSYYFFSKGFKTLYARASKQYIDKREYDDKLFENKTAKSFKQVNSYQWTFRHPYGDEGYIHYIYDRDEDKYERYFSGGSKYYYSLIIIDDYTSDCNTTKKVKTNCAIIQAMVEYIYTAEKNSRERGEKYFDINQQIKKLNQYLN